jgi:hypothetical protein
MCNGRSLNFVNITFRIQLNSLVVFRYLTVGGKLRRIEVLSFTSSSCFGEIFKARFGLIN